MTNSAQPVASEIDLAQPQAKGLLRFITCGSVDDGKSTLIGRLLVESKLLFDDQLAALAIDSRKLGTRNGELDCALLLDGLSAEREQGITIDVAYRYFSTDRRKFIVADTPGHEQYTRNMITGASTADLAVIVIDARKGLQVQTLRHGTLLSLIGIRHVVFAITKMDLVAYSQEVFEHLRTEALTFAGRTGIEDAIAIPVSGVYCDNIVAGSERTAWYAGPALLQYLETVEIDEERLQRLPLRMPVQWINRPHLDFRGFAGTIAAGAIKPGDRVCVLPSGRQSTVARIVTADGDLDAAVAHQSITLTFSDEIDVSRGDLISSLDSPAAVADQFEATLVWLGEQPMLPGRRYLLKIGSRTVSATVMPLKHKIDVTTQEHLAATTLTLNEIGVVDLALDRPIAFDPYALNRDTGGFILIDKLSNSTVGAGMLKYSLRRASNIQWQTVEVSMAARRAMNGHRSAVIWFTGLSGAGKTSLANALEKRLHSLGKQTYLLDGDNLRHGLNKDLGFTPADRVENIRRVAAVAKLMVDAGLIVLTAFISPFRAERQMARELFDPGEFIEVFVDTPLAAAESRDPKGLYKRARRGELKNFTGIDSPYEAPTAPDIHIDTTRLSLPEAAEQVFDRIQALGVLDTP